MPQVVFVGLVFLLITIIITVYFLHYDYQIMGSSVKPSQMRLSNWTPAEPPAYQIISLVPVSAALLKLFREPKYDVMKGCNTSCDSVLTIKGTLTREREAT